MPKPRGVSGRTSRAEKRDKSSGSTTWLAFAGGGGIAAAAALVTFLFVGGKKEDPPAVAPQAVATVATTPQPTAPPVPPAVPPAGSVSHSAHLPVTNPAAAHTAAMTTPQAVAVAPVKTPGGFSVSMPPSDSIQPTAVNAAGAHAAPAATAASATPSPGTTKNYADLVEEVDRSVVRLNVETVGGPSVGSGFVVTDSGIVVTNYHVIEGGRKVSIEFEDGRTCGVLGYKIFDQARDIAIIQLAPEGAPFVPVALAKHMPRKGEDVAAFGAPLGLSFTASKGTITNIRDGKELEMEGSYVQTDTSISPGNSGGPLVSMAGEVVGMNSFQLRIGQNLNFAVSATDIREVLAASESQSVKEINPKNVPTRRQEIPKMVDITGTERADKLLAQISQAALFIKPFEIDPTGRINEYMFDNLKKTVKTKLKLDLTRINELRVDESVIILGVMWSAPEDEAQQERLASQMSLEMVVVMLDVNKDGQRTPSIVYKTEEKLAVLSISALAQGNLTNSVRDGAKRFFDRFSSTVIKARKAAGVQ